MDFFVAYTSYPNDEYLVSVSDFISIINLIVTSGIVIWIGVTYTRNVATNKALKDFFVSETNDIRNEYKTFQADLFKNQLSSKYIVEWFKLISIKIDIFEDSLKNEFKVETKILHNHNKLKQFITSTDRFNQSYSKKHVILSSRSKLMIIQNHRDMTVAITDVLININKAKKNKKPWYKFSIRLPNN